MRRSPVVLLPPLRMLLGAALLLAAAPPATAGKKVDFGKEKTYAAPNDLGEACRVVEDDYCKVVFPEPLSDDGALIHSHLKNAIIRLIQDFSEFDPERLLKGDVDCRVHVYDKPNDKASEAMAQIRNEWIGDKYIAELSFLAPSKHSPEARDSMGRLKDKEYFSYLVAHEYSAVILDRITRAKSGGWTIYGSPDWFHQGYEQYLGLKYSSIGKETFAAYVEGVRKDPARISSSSYGLFVQDSYEDGALLLKFMNEAFGEPKVHALLNSPKTSFFAAMEDVIGPKDAFMAEWEKWFKKQ